MASKLTDRQASIVAKYEGMAKQAEIVAKYEGMAKDATPRTPTAMAKQPEPSTPQTPADLFVSAAVPKFQTVEETRAALQGYDDRYSGYATDPLSSQLYQSDTQMFRDREQELSLAKESSVPMTQPVNQLSTEGARAEKFAQKSGRVEQSAVESEPAKTDTSEKKGTVGKVLKGAAKQEAGELTNAFWSVVNALNKSQAYSMGPDEVFFNMAAGIDPGQAQQQKIERYNSPEAEAFRQEQYAKADALAEAGAADIASAKEGLGKGGQFAVDLGVGATQLLGDVALGAINPALSVGALAARSFGGGAQEARQAGASEEEAFLTGAAQAGKSVLLNKLLGGLGKVYGKSKLSGVTDKLWNKMAKTPAVANALKATMNTEGLEEVIEAAIDPAIRTIYSGRSLAEEYSEEELADWLYQGAIGQILGTGATGLELASSAGRPTQTTLQNEPQNASDGAGGTQIPASPGTVSTNAPDVLNTAEQPKSGIDMVVEAATGNKNAAPSQGTDSTAVNTNPAQHTPAEQAVIDEYQNAVDDNLVVAVEAVANNPDKPFSRHNISDVSQRQADEVSAKLGGDYTGYKNAINTNGIKHILNRHGVNGEQDNSMADVNDIARVGYVLNNFDAIDIATDKKGNQRFSLEFRTSDDKPAPMVVFSKKVNGTYYVVEAVPDTKYKKMWVVSAYMDKKGGFTQAPDANSPENTPNASLASQPQYEAEASNPYIAQSGSNVNAGSESGQGPERVRGYEQNVASSEVTDPELKARVEESLQTYRQLGNVDTLKKAQDIMLRGLPEAQAELQQALGKAKDGAKLAPEMVPLSRLVANELTRNGDVATARQIIADVAVELTAAGQLGQAARIMRTADPATALDSIRKALDKINAEVKRQMPTAKWTAELTAEEEQLIAETDFTQDGAFEAIYKQIAKRLGAEMPTTFKAKVREFRKVSMLLNPKTQIKNIIGNVPLMLERKLADGLSAAIQQLAVTSGIISEADATRAMETQQSRDLATEFYKANKAEINDSGGSKAGLRGMLREEQQYFGGGIMDKARKLTYGALKWGDTPFVQSAFVDSLSQYIAAQGITDIDSIPRAAIDKAINDANRATFKNDNAIAKLLNQLKSKGGFGEAVDILLPFTNTPLNIASEFAQYSPIGFFKGVGQAAKGAKTGDAATIVAAIDSIAQGLTGSAVIGLGYLLANKGWITGSEDEDKDKAALDRATGQQAYSILGKWSYDWAQPVGSQLAMGAEIADAIANSEGGLGKALTDGIIAAGDAYFEQTFFKNLIELVQNFGSPTEDLLETLIESGTGQMYPSIVGALARTIDPVVRSSYTNEDGLFSGVDEQLKAKTPWLSETLPASINVKGEEQSRGTLGQRILDNFILPWNTNRNQRSAVDDEVYRIMEKTGSKTHLPSVSPYKVEFDGETFKMTGEERAKFQTTQGQAYQDIVGELIDNAVYKKASLEQKREVLDDVREYSLKLAKDEFLAGKGEEYDWQSKSQETASKLSDPAAYLAEMAIAKSKAESRGDTFSTDGRDSFAYFTERGINAKDLDIISGSMLGERQQEVYNTFRGADFAPDVVMSMYKQMDGEKQDGRYNQADVYAILSSISDDVMSAEQKAIVWANTQSGSTDWAAYLAKNAR